MPASGQKPSTWARMTCSRSRFTSPRFAASYVMLARASHIRRPAPSESGQHLSGNEQHTGASEREQRQQLLAAARRREIDVVLVWRLDRWGRSVADLVSTLQELQHLGVGFVSLTEALDLTTPAGRAMAGL